MEPDVADDRRARGSFYFEYAVGDRTKFRTRLDAEFLDEVVT